MVIIVVIFYVINICYVIFFIMLKKKLKFFFFWKCYLKLYVRVKKINYIFYFFFNWWIELILENWIRFYNFYNFIYFIEEEELIFRLFFRGRVFFYFVSGLWLLVFFDWLDSMFGELEKGEEEDELKFLIILLVINRI